MSILTVFILFFGISHATFAATKTYKVKAGDTLSKIAKKNHVTVSQIKKWNHLKSDFIKVNQKLTLQTSSSKSGKVSSSSNSYRVISVKATAYTASCGGCSGITSTGINLKKHPSAKVISVDPKVIPLGSKVYVPGYGTAVAGDKGSGIKGNHIDVFISKKSKAIDWGSKKVKIKVYR